MTKGKIIVITKNGIYETNEFDSDMYVNGYGEIIINLLRSEHTDTLPGIKKMVKEFCRIYFEDYDRNEYKEYEKVFPSGSYLDFSEKTYQEEWHSDYIYIKNSSQDTVEIIDCDGEIETIEPNEIQVYYFGEKMTDERIHIR